MSGRGSTAVNVGECVMDTRSDFVETDLLTFDIPDDVLERAAGAELAFTLVHCSNPLVWDCPAMGEVSALNPS
jgi:hypothetical protein